METNTGFTRNPSTSGRDSYLKLKEDSNNALHQKYASHFVIILRILRTIWRMVAYYPCNKHPDVDVSHSVGGWWLCLESFFKESES